MPEKDHRTAAKLSSFFRKGRPPQPSYTPWGQHEQLPWQREIQPLPEEGRKRKPEGPVAEAKALKTETITGARELCSCRKSGTRMFSQSCIVCILEPTCCSYVPPSSKEIPPFYISELPTRHGHSNPRSMDIGRSAGLQDTIH